MKFKVIRQLDDSVTVEFYNAKDEKIDYEIIDVQKDGLGYVYNIKGLRISPHRKKKEVKENDQ